MNFIKKINYHLRYLGVPKNQRLDDYIINIISEQTGFDSKEIDLNYASKTKMDILNEFNYFEFIYRKKRYILENGIIKEDSN